MLSNYVNLLFIIAVFVFSLITYNGIKDLRHSHLQLWQKVTQMQVYYDLCLNVIEVPHHFLYRPNGWDDSSRKETFISNGYRMKKYLHDQQAELWVKEPVRKRLEPFPQKAK